MEDEFNYFMDGMKKMYYKMRENLENECCESISEIFYKYGQFANAEKIKEMINFIYIFNSYGIDTYEKCHKLLIECKEKGML